MALINEELRKFICADTIIHASVKNRVYSDYVPPQQNQMPCIVYNFIDGVSSATLAGKLDHARARVQIDVISDKRTESMTIAERLRILLEGHRGTMQGSWCQEIELDSTFRFAVDEAEDDKRRFITSQDFGIHYQQATT